MSLVRFTMVLVTTATVAALAGCTRTSSVATSASTAIAPGPNAQKQVQEALIKAKPGATITLKEGKFDFTQTLSLEDAEGVTLRGEGQDKTILNFANQIAGAGGEGIIVKSGNFKI